MDSITFLFGAQPEVRLLYATPTWVPAMATKGYTGNYSGNINRDEEQKFWEDLGNTKLKTPLEMANTFWLLGNVTRAFTHQLARYRQGVAIVQESQRFVVQGGGFEELGHNNRPIVLIPNNIARDQSKVENYCEAVENAFNAYWEVIRAGTPVEDARNLLPTATCTRLYLSVNMRTLAHIYEQRACCQAQQEEWSIVLEMMKYELAMGGFHQYEKQLIAPWEDPNCISCGFGASFDRPCTNQALFNANLEALETTT